MTNSPTLKRLQEEHPEWCSICGKIERGPIHSCYESPVMVFIKDAIATLDAQLAERDALEARVLELEAALGYAIGGFDVVYENTRLKSIASNMAAHQQQKARAALKESRDGE